MKTRVLIISDTHGMHFNLTGVLPKANMIVHSGDFCNSGSRRDVEAFMNWFNALDYTYRVAVAGNHDVWLERARESEVKAIIPPDITYLCDQGATVGGLKIWGSPYQPEFMNWAFNEPRGEACMKHWEKIPTGLDLLITHGPPYGICDQHPNWDVRGEFKNSGCEELRKVVDVVKPKVHAFGHIHYSGHTTHMTANTLFINASICDEGYIPRNKPYLVDFEDGRATLVECF